MVQLNRRSGSGVDFGLGVNHFCTARFEFPYVMVWDLQLRFRPNVTAPPIQSRKGYREEGVDLFGALKS